MGLALALGLLTGAQAALLSGAAWVPLAILCGALLIPALLFGAAARGVLVLALVGLVLGVGIASQTRAHPSPSPTNLPAMITAQIEQDPDVTAGGFRMPASWRDASGFKRDVLLFLPVAPQPSRGMRVEAYGEFPDATGAVFYADSVRITSQPAWHEQQRQRLRGAMESALVHRVGGAESALALGLLTGDDSALSKQRTDNLRTAGLSHLTAVSGWNVALVATAAAAVLAPLPLNRRVVWLLQALVIALFVWIVGADAPVLRAGIMAQSALISRWFGRPTHSVTALLLAAGLMALEEPEMLTSLSFRLSLAATAAMIVAAELTRALPDWPLPALREAALTSALAGIATAPILAGGTGSLALWTVPANVLVAPLIPPATIVGAATSALDTLPLIGPPLATVTGAATALLCGLVLAAADGIAGLPGAQQNTTWLTRPMLAGISAALLVAWFAWLPEGRWLGRVARTHIDAHAAAFVVAAGSALVTVMLALLVLRAV